MPSIRKSSFRPLDFIMLFGRVFTARNYKLCVDDERSMVGKLFCCSDAADKSGFGVSVYSAERYSTEIRAVQGAVFYKAVVEFSLVKF